MKLPKLSLLAIAVIAFTLNGLSQSNNRSGNWCGFDEIIQKQLDNNPMLLENHFTATRTVKNNTTNNKKPGPYIIPVVVHNITHSGGVGYVSKATIDAAIDRLNIDFNRLNSDTTNTRSLFKPHAGSLNIEFRLAHLDPNSQCTEGIVRVEHPESADFHDADKSISFWDSKKYFNIWVVDLITGSNPPSYIAGYAQFPGSGINNTYGVVIDNSFFGANNRTLTHEVGHCFGLLHTFQSGCGGNCSSTGDRMCDTPPAANSTQACDLNQNTCSNDANGPDPYGTNVVDQIENYMSYDNCQNMFSLDQIAEMEANLDNTSTTNGLNQLTVGSNLNATGTNNPYGPANCAPIADFSYNKQMICEGSTVTFTDDSYNATPTGWSWTFAGGTPGVSSAPNPTIVYNTAGVYSVTHQPSTTAGSDMITKNNIITVSSLTADYTSPVTDGFENTTQFNNDWIVIDGFDNYNWENTNTASATGSRCIRLANFVAGSSGSDYDYIVSPSYDLSSSSSKMVTFKVAYANRTANDDDRLYVYYSTNCGETWSPKLLLTNANLKTAPDHTNSFVPTAGEWDTKSMDFTSIGSATNLRLRFEFRANGGNNVYIDDINIGGTVGIDEQPTNIGSFTVFPNPTNASAKVSFNLLSDVNNLSIKVKNALGQTVTNIVNAQSFNTGKYTLKIDEGQKLSSGIYFIEFNADNNIKTQKLIIQ